MAYKVLLCKLLGLKYHRYYYSNLLHIRKLRLRKAEIFPVVLTCLKDKDEYVKKNASTLIREIAKHTPEVKQGEKKSASKYNHMLLV